MYICDFASARPLQAIEISKNSLCKYMETSPSGDLMVLGFDNGEFQIRSTDKLDRFLSIKMHDGQAGKITSVKFDPSEKLVLSTAEDGLMYAHLIYKENIKKESIYNPLEDVENLEYIPEDQKNDIISNNWSEFRHSNPPMFAHINPETDSLDAGLLAHPLKLNEEINEDILDPS
jgi:hypothetical protein